MTSNQKKRLAGLVTSLVFLLPYERIPSFAVQAFGTSIDLRLSFIAGAILILLVAWSLAFTKDKLQARLSTFHYALAGFFFVYLLSALISTDLKRALIVWIFTAFTAAVGVSVGLAWRYCDSAAVRKALWVTTWIALAFGFYQYIGDIIGLSTSWTGLREIYTKEVFGFPRIQSTGLEPLFYGNFLLIPLFYFATRFLTGSEERPLFLLALITQLVLTVSRGALIGGLTGMMLILALYFRRSQIQQKAGLVGLTVLGIALALLLTNVNSLQTLNQNQAVSPHTPAPVGVINQATNLTSQDDRVRNRILAWEAFRSQPWLGIGPGNFSAYAKDRYEGYRAAEGQVVVNNEPLEMLAEGGLIGSLALLGFVIALIAALIRRIRESEGSDLDWTIALLAYFVALGIQYQTFSTLYIMQVWVTLGIAMGLAVVPASQPIKTVAKVTTSTRSSIRTPTKKSKKRRAKKK